MVKIFLECVYCGYSGEPLGLTFGKTGNTAICAKCNKGQKI